ncbi:hypothetical protein [Labedaea rhizosphaerae]|uniref:Uncharacterized protein n=1 Tax=Labedaea rhizosphaerae TaxID=598644 RepID=A0A4V3D0D8_LABRH|nr:hypothetical protein [Labedaea rhizosphaerae]TDQ05425.1 hypothetical protein EV186_1011395 [Labedaea rhizosphaerae]
MEVATVRGGAGVVDVRGGAASVLYLGGAPAALDGDDCAGSIGRLWARAKTTPPRPEALAALGEFTTVGYTANGLADDLRPVLDLLADGTYTLSGPEPITAERWFVASAAPGEFGSDYPWELDYLVPTQAWPVTDWGTVARYRKLIAHGQRPVVLALRADDSPFSGFVLDGHHKLAAYLALREPPVLVRIARTDAPRVTAREVRTHFPGAEARYLLRALDAPRG